MKRRRHAIALLLSACLLGGAARAAADTQYAVATANPAATEAGMRILAMGGSAADAAVAIQMVLGVVEPQSSGLGGGAIALYRSAQERRMTAFDGLAKSPAEYDPQAGAAAHFSHSGAAVGVPGGLRMLEAMHRRYGKLPWDTLFQPAIELAERGFPVSPYLARSLAAASRAGMEVPPWLTDGSGKPVTEGATVRNPALAETLRAVASHGADALYTDLADQIVAAARHGSPGGRMTVEDITTYKAVERVPLCLPLRQRVLCAFPPPSYGGVVVLEMLGILDKRGSPLDSFLDPGFVHRFIEAGRLAEADRMALVGDPDTGHVSVGELLSPAHLQARAALIRRSIGHPGSDSGTATPRLWAGRTCARAVDQPDLRRRRRGKCARDDHNDQRELRRVADRRRVLPQRCDDQLFGTLGRAAAPQMTPPAASARRRPWRR